MKTKAAAKTICFLERRITTRFFQMIAPAPWNIESFVSRRDFAELSSPFPVGRPCLSRKRASAVRVVTASEASKRLLLSLSNSHSLSAAPKLNPAQTKKERHHGPADRAPVPRRARAHRKS